jgi:phosphotransferase system HPr (HPr) family protein
MSDLKASRTVVVSNPQGLHARPADMFVKTACRFTSKVEIVKGFERVDGKSILSLLTLAAGHGTELTIETTGDDAESACQALADLITNLVSED